GQTHRALRDCMNIVFQALLQSPRPAVEKILYAIDRSSGDGYGLSDGGKQILQQDWPAETWSAAADALTARLRARKRPEGSDREHLVNDLANALEKAGRGAEVLPLFEAEAPITNSYLRLVNQLLDAQRPDDAERWALEGIQLVERYDGARLRNVLRDLADKRQDWPRVAAFQAEAFFDEPGVAKFQELMKTAEKASCGQAVRSAALNFLETGERPTVGPKWPLPDVPRVQVDPPGG